MATDRSLATLLRALQTPSSDQDASRLLGSATNLLVLLSNPLNITLLTSHILSAPAIWCNPDGLRTPLRVLSVFNVASIQKSETEAPLKAAAPYPAREGLAKEEWVKAVVRGADERTPRWKHMLLLGGLLLGFESQDRHGLPPSLRRKVEGSVVKAGNLALEAIEEDNELSATTIAVVLSNVFNTLSSHERRAIDHERLLPLLVRTIFFTKGGLDWGYFLGTLDADIIQTTEYKFNWSAKSSTYFQLQRMASGPLVGALGSLSRLTAFSVENVKSVDLLLTMTGDISAFTRSLGIQWRQNKLSEIDITEEGAFLHDEALNTTLPPLWQVLKSTLFAVIVIQRSLLGRILGDRQLPCNVPFIAVQTLLSLRGLYFVSARLGHNSFSQYTFVYLTSIDILSNYPIQAEAFLREIRPAEFGRIPQHPHERNYDLFFLNTAEHFTLSLPSSVNEDLLIGAASPYLATGEDFSLVESFEAAHSVVLSALTTPHSSDLTTKYLRFYVDVLFKAFPQSLSPRQFRMAIRTLVRITSPPSPISAQQALLPSSLLELVRDRADSAPTTPLPLLSNQIVLANEASLSEQAVLVLTLIDSLCVLPIDTLEEWLPIAAKSIHAIREAEMADACKRRLWDALSNGEMDVARAASCVAWWNTGGGREMLLRKDRLEKKEPIISGALGTMSKL